jgi:hypothetical protein
MSDLKRSAKIMKAITFIIGILSAAGVQAETATLIKESLNMYPAGSTDLAPRTMHSNTEFDASSISISYESEPPIYKTTAIDWEPLTEPPTASFNLEAPKSEKKTEPNKTLQRMPMSVTPDASASAAPATGISDL